MNDIIDMSQFVEAKSDQLNADDLIGAPRTITVRKVTGNDGDQPISIWFEGDNNKPFKPCKTMRRVLLAIWGRNAADYAGRSMTIYRDDSVTFGGLAVGGIRISHMSHLDKETVVVVMKTKGKKAGIKILPLRTQQTDRQPDDAAAKWAAQFIANIRQATSADAVTALRDSKQARLAELEAKRPDLHSKVAEAIAEMLDSFGEKRAEADMGEGFNDDLDFGDE